MSSEPWSRGDSKPATVPGTNYSLSDAVTRDIDTSDLLDYAAANQQSFGLNFLDDALLGVLPNDLVLIGAKPGRGKTSASIEIAKNNAMAGKRVVFIALEAEQNEVEMRLRYQLEAAYFFQDDNRPRHVNMSYRTWRFGKFKAELAPYAAKATRLFTERYATLRTVYRRKKFAAEDLNDVLKETYKDADLFVIDHLHYFDLLSSKENQNVQTSELVKNIRSLNLFYNKPFILVAHLRKESKGAVPDLDDFMGSSDIGKVATIAVMLTPMSYDAKDQVFKTGISIAKSRTGNPGLVGIMDYSLRHNVYLLGYKLGKVHGEKIEELQATDYPDWAVNATLPKPGR
jgi:replicative DNA helicase